MIVNENLFATKCVIKSKTWFDIGKLIHSLSDGCNEGYRLWLMYSSTDYKNYDELDCDILWSEFDSLTSEDFVELNESNELPEGY